MDSSNTCKGHSQHHGFLKSPSLILSSLAVEIERIAVKNKSSSQSLKRGYYVPKSELKKIPVKDSGNKVRQTIIFSGKFYAASFFIILASKVTGNVPDMVWKSLAILYMDSCCHTGSSFSLCLYSKALQKQVLLYIFTSQALNVSSFSQQSQDNMK